MTCSILETNQTVIDVIWNLFVESGVKAQIHGFEKTNGHL